MVAVGLKVDKPSEGSVAAAGNTHPEGVRGRGGTGGDGVGYNGFTTKMEGGYWGIGLVEVVWKVCAEFSTQVKCDATQRTALVQDREGYRDINLGRKVGAAVGRDCALASVPGFPGFAEGV